MECVVSGDDPRGARAKRVRRVRDDWRKDDRAARKAAEPEPAGGGEERRAESLGSLDRIRAEAPNDLETRRAADQLEREIETSRKERD